ncbi:MAG: CRISPR-associated endonuclease Cas3'' [Thermogladius sp.]|jgi:CRISPR-associated endonuclease Cas3-HD|nr:CRISPR-associated endonuclease Cas3'' [Thermogladius sp.]
MPGCGSPPYSFYEVKGGKARCEGLVEHSLATACVASRVFGERLSRVFGNADVDVGYLLNLSAYLHDIGKASSLYQREAASIGEGGSMSFWLHHVVSFIVLQVAYMEKTDPVLQYASYAVMRHHQAMKSTHEVCEVDSKGIRHLTGAVKSLNINWIEEVLEVGESRGFISRPHAEVVLEAAGDLVGLDDESIARLGEASCRGDLLRENTVSKRLVVSVAGAVIVSDIAVSSLTRGGGSLLAEMWMRELPSLRPVAEECISEAGGAGGK